jgi:outer membrane autotransporter protein
MLRKLMYLVPVVALLALPAMSLAQFEAGNWALELSGQGNNDQDFENGSFAAQAELGYFLSKELEVGLRQSIQWSDFGDSTWAGTTGVFADYHFDLDRWQPYVGAAVQYSYGDEVDETWFGGPEGGVKYFVNSTTYIDLNVLYGFNLEDGIDDGAFFYSLGIGFRW